MSGKTLQLLNLTSLPEKYSSKKIDNETLRAIFAAGRIAPSADNMQIWRFILAEDKEVKKNLIGALLEKDRQQLFNSAPTIVACLGAPWFLKGATKEQPFFMIDVPIAVSHLLLTAVDLGLAPVFTQQIDEDPMLEAVDAKSDQYRAVGLLALGYPA